MTENMLERPLQSLKRKMGLAGDTVATETAESACRCIRGSVRKLVSRQESTSTYTYSLSDTLGGNYETR